MVKIVHTADIHFGLEFSRFPSISDKLKEERLNALRSIVERANKEMAHAIVVAGDLFEKLSIPQKLVKDIKGILAGFNGEVVVIPGNHDWFNPSADENKVWSWFADAPGSNVHFLKSLKVFSTTLNGQAVQFFPCGCHQKHCDENRIGWVKQAVKNTENVNIGIAHGNVDGFGLDEEGNYFGMSVNELKEAGMDCWLLGHIHAPYPAGDTAGHEELFFAGNHCPDSWKNERSGGAWLIEIDDEKNVKANRWKHSGISFSDRTKYINNSNDFDSVCSELKTMNASQSILRLTLRGSLTEEDLQEAKTKVKELTETFLFAEIIWSIGLKITPESINKLYVEDSIPHTLLTDLSQNEKDTLAMQLAYETIQNLTK